MRVEIDTIRPTPAALARAIDAVEIIGKVGKVEMAVVIDEHASAEPAESSLDFGVGGKFAAIGLGKTFQDCRKIAGHYRFRLVLVAGELQHGTSDVVLRFGWQSPYLFKGRFEQFGHEPTIAR